MGKSRPIEIKLPVQGHTAGKQKWALNPESLTTEAPSLIFCYLSGLNDFPPVIKEIHLEESSL